MKIGAAGGGGTKTRFPGLRSSLVWSDAQIRASDMRHIEEGRRGDNEEDLEARTGDFPSVFFLFYLRRFRFFFCSALLLVDRSLTHGELHTNNKKINDLIPTGFAMSWVVRLQLQHFSLRHVFLLFRTTGC